MEFTPLPRPKRSAGKKRIPTIGTSMAFNRPLSKPPDDPVDAYRFVMIRDKVQRKK